MTEHQFAQTLDKLVKAANTNNTADTVDAFCALAHGLFEQLTKLRQAVEAIADND